MRKVKSKEDNTHTRDVTVPERRARGMSMRMCRVVLFTLVMKLRFVCCELRVGIFSCSRRGSRGHAVHPPPPRPPHVETVRSLVSTATGSARGDWTTRDHELPRCSTSAHGARTRISPHHTHTPLAPREQLTCHALYRASIYASHTHRHTKYARTHTYPSGPPQCLHISTPHCTTFITITNSGT